MEFLERIRRKPDQVKARYAFGGALGATLLVGLVWSLSLPARFAEIGDAEIPFAASAESITDIIEDTKTQMGNAIESTDPYGELNTSSVNSTDRATLEVRPLTQDQSLGAVTTPTPQAPIKEEETDGETRSGPSNFIFKSTTTSTGTP